MNDVCLEILILYSTNSNFPFDQQKESTIELVTTIITNFIFHQHTIALQKMSYFHALPNYNISLPPSKKPTEITEYPLRIFFMMQTSTRVETF